MAPASSSRGKRRAEGSELLTPLRDGGGEGEDEPVGVALVGIAQDGGQDSHRRYRDVATGDASARWCGEDGGGAHDVVVVEKRLALALEHDARHRPLGRIAPDGQDLLDHLPRLEVAGEAEPARLAEGAAQSASHLRRHAQAEARFLQGDADRLEGVAVRCTKEVLDEGIHVTGSALDDAETGRDTHLAEPQSSRFGQAPDTVEVIPVEAHQPVKHSSCHVSGKKVCSHQGRESLRRIAAQMGHWHHPSEPQDVAASGHVDLHLGVSDAHDLPSVVRITLADHVIVQQRDVSVPLPGDGMEPG